MNEIPDFLIQHGTAVLLVVVFIEQLGVPLPCAPWLLAAGALAGSGKMNWLTALGAATFGSLVADTIWFYVGRFYGGRILKVLCRISLEPDSCVRRTQNIYTRSGLNGLIVAKFIPGFSIVAPPLAGSYGVSILSFVIYDGLGSLVYGGSFLLVGGLFRRQLDQVLHALSGLGGGALALVAGLFLLYIGYKVYQRQRLLNELRMARISVDELHQRLEAGEKPVVVDLRSHHELDLDPVLIRGAIHLSYDEVEARHVELPRDREIILYCACPNEVSSARMALKLRRQGISHVRPLLGGIDAWRERNYPTEPMVRLNPALEGQAQLAAS